MKSILSSTLAAFAFRAPRAVLACGVIASVLIASMAPGFAQSAVPVPPKAAETAPARTEITTYDNWTVTCRDGQGKEKRVCSAELNVTQEVSGGRRVVLSWVVGTNAAGTLLTALRFPPGVMIAPGLDLKLQGKPSRKLPITECEPTYCAAAATIDDALLKDALAAQQAEAIVQTSDGRRATFTINMKGFSQAITALRK